MIKNNFRMGVWLVCFIIIVFSLFFFSWAVPAQAAECRLINILTNKSQVRLGESMQVNVTARRECIGRTARIHICDALSCHEIASQTFSSRTVGGQEAISPVVLNLVSSDFFEENTTAWVQATVPFNTVKSRSVFVVINEEKVQFGEFCTDTDQCEEGLICAGNICVECDVNALNTCASGQVCRDGVCAAGDGDGDDGNNDGSDGVLRTFPGEDLEAGDVIKIVVGLSCWLIRVAFTLTIIFVILAGFQFMTAQGNATKYQAAVKSFQNVLWGVLVIYGVYVIIATVAHAVGVTDFSFIPLVC